jgi:hypothetical protein
MLISSFDKQELEILAMALRYWRAHRSDVVTRRTDPPLTHERIELLLAKLGYHVTDDPTPDVPDDVSPSFSLR